MPINTRASTNTTKTTGRTRARARREPTVDVSTDTEPDVKPDVKPVLRPFVGPVVEPGVVPDVKPDIKPVKRENHFIVETCDRKLSETIDRKPLPIKIERCEEEHQNSRSESRQNTDRVNHNRNISDADYSSQPGPSRGVSTRGSKKCEEAVGQRFVIKLKSLRCPANTRTRNHLSPDDVYIPLRDKYHSPRKHKRERYVERRFKRHRKSPTSSDVASAERK